MATRLSTTPLTNLDTAGKLNRILCQVPDTILTSNLTASAIESLQGFLEKQPSTTTRRSSTHRKRINNHDNTNSPLLSQKNVLSEMAATTAETLREMAACTTIGQLAVRRSLQQASRQLLNGSTMDPTTTTTTTRGAQESPSSSPGCVPVVTVAVALALVRQQQQQDGYSRAAASAMASTLDAEATTDCNTAACAILQALLLSSAQDDRLDVDWHVITSVARGLGMKGTPDDDTQQQQQQQQAVATIVSRVLFFNNDDALPEKTQVAAILALAAQFRPWQQLSPASLIEVAVALDLWHAAESVCTSSLPAAQDKDAVSSSRAAPQQQDEAAVITLIDAALEAKTYRRADTYATQFYHVGGQSRYVLARLRHACDTMAKVVRKGALPVLERQIDRVDRAVERVREDRSSSSGSTQYLDDDDDDDDDGAKEQVRIFALRQLEEAGEMDAARRLAELYGLDHVYNEEALRAAAEARRQKYLQWEDVSRGDDPPPELTCTPEGLLLAFSANAAQDGGVYGFDVEWSDDDVGADLLQIAIPKGVVILIDIPALSKTEQGVAALGQTVGALFASRSAKVVGFGCRQDVTRLRTSPCVRKKEHWLSGTTTAVVDVQKLLVEKDPKLKGLGLSRACHHFLGKPLDKLEQCSYWGARPLSVQQRTYAALDAWVCQALYAALFPIATSSVRDEFHNA